MRYAFVNTLIKEAKKNKNIMLLSGDLGFTVFEEFKKTFPNRFINVGVAEQNMMGIAAGLALSGKIVFTYSIATFATMRPLEQIRNDVALHNVPVIIVGTGAGLSYGEAANTHYAIEDIHLMRGIPGMTILCPADPIEAVWATQTAVRLKKPLYLRLGKKGEPTIHKNTPKLQIGKGAKLTQGNDFVILATGNIVAHALWAAGLIKRYNKKTATVISMHTIKPIDKKLILTLTKKFPLIVTVEEHNIIGGLGSAVSEIIAEEKTTTTLLRIGIPDTFVTVIGSQEYLRKKMNLTPELIAKTIIAKLA